MWKGLDPVRKSQILFLSWVEKLQVKRFSKSRICLRCFFFSWYICVSFIACSDIYPKISCDSFNPLNLRDCCDLAKCSHMTWHMGAPGMFLFHPNIVCLWLLFQNLFPWKNLIHVCIFRPHRASSASNNNLLVLWNKALLITQLKGQ